MKKVLLLFFTIVLTSCSKKQVVVPEDVISRDTMIVILSEIHLAEASIQVLSVDMNDSTQNAAYGLYRYIFQKHKITDADFKRSFDFYQSNPAYFHEMYNDVITRLSEDQAKASSSLIKPVEENLAKEKIEVSPLPK